MKTPSQKLLLTAVLSAVGIATMLAGPAFAQRQYPSYHQRTPQSRYYAPPSAQQLNSDIPHYGDAPYDQRDDW